MKKGIKIMLFAAVAVLIAAGILVCNHFINKPNRSAESTSSSDMQTSTAQEKSSAPEVVDPESIVWDDGGYTGVSDGLINFLFIGQDRREGEGRQRSDAMILCSLNPETCELSMISFLRDLYVQIPGYEDNRLNAAYAYGGFPLLKEALYKNFGVSVDGCLEVDFENFISIVDTVGGIDVELTRQEAEIIGEGTSQGLCHLNGSQTLTYARIRKIDSDFERTRRQRTVLSAVFSKLKNIDVAGRLSFAAEILPMITTDMNDEQLMSLAARLASVLDGLEVSTHCIPAEGAYKNAIVREMMVLIPDIEKNKRIIFEEYLPES